MTVQDEFWNWFREHEAELFELDASLEEEREELFDRLMFQLNRVDPGLVFEFGPNGPVREFVISAAGIEEVFPAVVSLADAAPALERWRITAFRPRCTPISGVEVNGKRIGPDDVRCSLLDNGIEAGLYLLIPGFREEDPDWKEIGYLLLDEALGEFDVETRLGMIKMLSPETPTGLDSFPLAELPVLFDALVARLEGRSGAPS